MKTNTRVRLIKNPYGEMLDVPVGTLGSVTSGGSAIVSIRFDNGVRAKAWMLVDGSGEPTLEVDVQATAAYLIRDARRRAPSFVFLNMIFGRSLAALDLSSEQAAAVCDAARLILKHEEDA